MDTHHEAGGHRHIDEVRGSRNNDETGDDEPKTASFLAWRDEVDQYVAIPPAEAVRLSHDFCARCEELEIQHFVHKIEDGSFANHIAKGSTSNKHANDRLVNNLVQRALFDSVEYGCFGCKTIKDGRHRVDSTGKRRLPNLVISGNGATWIPPPPSNPSKPTTWDGFLTTLKLRPVLAQSKLHSYKTLVSRAGLRTYHPRTVDWQALKHILTKCEHAHQAFCTPATSKNLRRIFLIDVVDRKLVRYPADGCNYIALSYVWGKVAAIPFRHGALPQTNRTVDDAIVAVCRLGLRYLWVDMICINQKDEHQLLAQIK